MIGFVKRQRRKKWLIEFRVKSIQEIYQNKWIAIRHDDGEYTVMPSWWAMWLTVRRFMKYISEGRLYIAVRNPYRK